MTQLSEAIRQIFEVDSDAVYTILVHESVARSGPFDGACRICAHAIQLAAGGDIVRIASNLNSTEHFGVKIDGHIYDGFGKHSTSDDWIDRLRCEENITDRALFYREGDDVKTDIKNDPVAAQKIADIIIKKIKLIADKKMKNQIK